MPYDDQNNDYDNQNPNTNSSQTQNLTQTQQTQPNAQKDNLDPKNPNNNIYSSREAINPFFVFSFIKGVIDYFGDLANRIAEKKDYKDGLKSGKAYRKKKEAKKAEKEKNKKERQAEKEAKKAKRAEKKEAKRKQKEQENITSPSPQSNEFSMFKFKGEETTKTPGRTEEERIRESKEAMEQAAKNRQARQTGQGRKPPVRTIHKPSGK